MLTINSVNQPSFESKPRILVTRTQLSDYVERGLSNQEIAKIINSSDSFVSSALKKYGIQRVRKNAHFKDILIPLLNQHLSLKEMAEKTGISGSKIHYWFSINGIKVPNSRAYKKNLKIAEEIKNGKDVKEIARDNNIDPFSVYKYIRLNMDKNEYKKIQQKKKSGKIIENLDDVITQMKASYQDYIKKYKEYTFKTYGKTKSESTRFKVYKLASEGMNISEIANELKCSTTSVRSYFTSDDLKMIVRMDRARRLEQIKQCVEQGLTLEEIAEKTGHSKGTMRNYLSGYANSKLTV